MPLLAELLGIKPLPKAIAEVYGSVPGGRDMEIITSYVAAFLKFAVTGKEQSLLEEPSAEFPQIKFIRS